MLGYAVKFSCGDIAGLGQLFQCADLKVMMTSEHPNRSTAAQLTISLQTHVSSQPYKGNPSAIDGSINHISEG